MADYLAKTNRMASYTFDIVRDEDTLVTVNITIGDYEMSFISEIINTSEHPVWKDTPTVGPQYNINKQSVLNISGSVECPLIFIGKKLYVVRVSNTFLMETTQASQIRIPYNEVSRDFFIRLLDAVEKASSSCM